jgi:hypothetical protein
MPIAIASSKAEKTHGLVARFMAPLARRLIRLEGAVKIDADFALRRQLTVAAATRILAENTGDARWPSRAALP